ncbi:transmembrane reductase CYB561D2-like [Harmonia axyridis]|uniref:transmembrane reductase CYB561D2-like n=1 Tax=Harmonia axyridis TaxID=115357 RepID=UPI001E276464|nr:transmembrane reductase CYB561D2-like [Harmonia axyridis]
MEGSEKNRDESRRTLSSIVTSGRVTNVVHLFIVAFAVYMLYLSFSGTIEFFTWHPILMSVGWTLLLTEGILILNRDNNVLKNIIGSNRILYHWILQALALILSIIGVWIAFQNKLNKSKAHFKSWHGLFGLLGFIFAILSGLNGVLTLYNRELKDYYSPKLNKFVHVVLGTLAYLFGGLSAILSVYTKWFEWRTHSDDIVFGILLFFIISTVIWTLVKPINSVSDRFRQLISIG